MTWKKGIKEKKEKKKQKGWEKETEGFRKVESTK